MGLERILNTRFRVVHPHLDLLLGEILAARSLNTVVYPPVNLLDHFLQA